MDTLNLYNNLENIGKKLYQNDNSAWVELREILPELSRFISEAVQLSEEIKKEIMSSFSQLLDAIENVDQLLTADTVYYRICTILEIYEKVYNNREIKTHEKINLDRINVDITKVYEKNKKCLENKWEGYYQKLIEYSDKFDLNDKEIAIDEYGNIETLKDNRWWRMNSFYNSEYAAQLGLEEIKKQKYISCLYIFGMGNLDTIRLFVNNVPSDTMVFIYEPDPKIFGVNSYYNDWSDILSKDNVVLFIEGLNQDELAKCTYIRMENMEKYILTKLMKKYGNVR